MDNLQHGGGSGRVRQQFPRGVNDLPQTAERQHQLHFSALSLYGGHLLHVHVRDPIALPDAAGQVSRLLGFR